ncbi:RNA-binding S4 domain-containing protein [Thermodesulfobacteriota bacterium]
MSDIIVEINRYPIRLGQFLKLANLVQDGLEAKALILEGNIVVNGETELRRGRQLNRDDIIIFENSRYLCR